MLTYSTHQRMYSGYFYPVALATLYEFTESSKLIEYSHQIVVLIVYLNTAYVYRKNEIKINYDIAERAIAGYLIQTYASSIVPHVEKVA